MKIVFAVIPTQHSIHSKTYKTNKTNKTNKTKNDLRLSMLYHNDNVLKYSYHLCKSDCNC